LWFKDPFKNPKSLNILEKDEKKIDRREGQAIPVLVMPGWHPGRFHMDQYQNLKPGLYGFTSGMVSGFLPLRFL
jgi:hypothetical protein